MKRDYRLTIIHPCVGRKLGDRKYIPTWKMEPLPAMLVAALTPAEVDVRFHDDRLESIPFDEPTDLVAISVETYTARRCYQIATEYRRRGVPVVMGGFHATLCPDEVARYADSVVVGEAESVFPELLDDYRSGRPKRSYRGQERPSLAGVKPDRSILRGKKYLPIRLVEFARGCRFVCDFCAITSYFEATQTHRPVAEVIAELGEVRRRGQLVFFIDDNITSDLSAAKELMEALIPLKIRWVGQSSINVAFDDEALSLMARSGCQGILIGLESLSPANLKTMNKGFNPMKGGPSAAIANLRRHGIRVYGTFIFGYDHDTRETFEDTVRFATEQGLFIAAFNPITPFPGTPLYDRLAREGRLRFDPWWLDPDYRYSMIPFHPRGMDPDELASLCMDARRRFYSWGSIRQRALHEVNHGQPFMFMNYLAINALHQMDIQGRTDLPLGDQRFQGELLEVR